MFEICQIGEKVLPTFLKQLATSTQGTPMPAPAFAARPFELNDGDIIPDVSSRFQNRTPEENEQIKSHVGKWIGSLPRVSLLITAICARPFARCFHAMIKFGTKDWETEQQARVVNGEQRRFRTVEAYKGDHVQRFFDEVLKLLKLDLQIACTSLCHFACFTDCAKIDKQRRAMIPCHKFVIKLINDA